VDICGYEINGRIPAQWTPDGYGYGYGANTYLVGRVRGSYYPYPTRPVDIFTLDTKTHVDAYSQPPMTFAGVFTGDIVTLDSTSRETFLHRHLLIRFSNAFQIGVAPIPFMVARSRLLETVVSDSSRRRCPRQRPLATHPLPHERKVRADSAARHCRCNHHATTLLRSEL